MPIAKVNKLWERAKLSSSDYNDNVSLDLLTCYVERVKHLKCYTCFIKRTPSKNDENINKQEISYYDRSKIENVPFFLIICWIDKLGHIAVDRRCSTI